MYRFLRNWMWSYLCIYVINYPPKTPIVYLMKLFYLFLKGTLNLSEWFLKCSDCCATTMATLTQWGWREEGKLLRSTYCIPWGILSVEVCTFSFWNKLRKGAARHCKSFQLAWREKKKTTLSLSQGEQSSMRL